MLRSDMTGLGLRILGAAAVIAIRNRYPGIWLARSAAA
jgi:hypothetical protein